MSDADLKPRQAQAEESRRKLLEAAIELFDEKGYNNVSIAEICEKAGFSTGAFYHYFASKEQIVSERYNAFALAADALFKEIDRRVRKEGNSSIDKLSEFIRIYLEYTNDQGVEAAKTAYRFMIRPSFKASKHAATMLIPHDIVASIVAEGQEAGEIRSDMSAGDIAMSLYNCVVGVLYSWLLPNVSFDLLEAGQKCIDLVMDGLRKR